MTNRIQLVRGMRSPEIVGRQVGHQIGGPPVGWRLLGANNRELGRSAASYPDVPEALAAITRAQATWTERTLVVSLDPMTGCWSWRATAPDQPSFGSSRAYQRRRESESSGARAVAALRDAIVVDVVLDVIRRPTDRPPRRHIPGARRSPTDHLGSLPSPPSAEGRAAGAPALTPRPRSLVRPEAPS